MSAYSKENAVVQQNKSSFFISLWLVALVISLSVILAGGVAAQTADSSDNDKAWKHGKRIKKKVVTLNLSGSDPMNIYHSWSFAIPVMSMVLTYFIPDPVTARSPKSAQI